jgi:hypothetical protein
MRPEKDNVTSWFRMSGMSYGYNVLPADQKSTRNSTYRRPPTMSAWMTLTGSSKGFDGVENSEGGLRPITPTNYTKQAATLKSSVSARCVHLAANINNELRDN